VDMDVISEDGQREILNAVSKTVNRAYNDATQVIEKVATIYQIYYSCQED